MNRNIRVVFSKADPALFKYSEVARGDWTLGREPVLMGEPIPPEVLKGIEKQMPAVCDQSKGSVRYARADVLYRMDFETVGDWSRRARAPQSAERDRPAKGLHRRDAVLPVFADAVGEHVDRTGGEFHGKLFPVAS